MRDATGRTQEFVSPGLLGLLLGLRTRGETKTLTFAVPAGSALAELDMANATDAAGAVIEHVLRGEPATDDVAVLVARFA